MRRGIRKEKKLEGGKGEGETGPIEKLKEKPILEDIEKGEGDS